MLFTGRVSARTQEDGKGVFPEKSGVLGMLIIAAQLILLGGSPGGAQHPLGKVPHLSGIFRQPPGISHSPLAR